MGRPGTLWPPLLITGYPHFRWKEVREIKQPQEQVVKRMNLNVPIDLHNAFKSTTAAQGQNMTDVLLEFIQKYITQNSPKQKAKRK